MSFSLSNKSNKSKEICNIWKLFIIRFQNLKKFIFERVNWSFYTELTNSLWNLFQAFINCLLTLCNVFFLTVEFDHSGSYLAIGGSDIRYLVTYMLDDYYLYLIKGKGYFGHLQYCMCMCVLYYRVYQVANVKSEWNCVKTFPDLSGTGFLHSFFFI